MKSKKLYKTHKYYTRQKISSYKNKTSKHISKARKLYKIDKIIPSKELSTVAATSASHFIHSFSVSSKEIFAIAEEFVISRTSIVCALIT